MDQIVASDEERLQLMKALQGPESARAAMEGRDVEPAQPNKPAQGAPSATADQLEVNFKVLELRQTRKSVDVVEGLEAQVRRRRQDEGTQARKAHTKAVE